MTVKSQEWTFTYRIWLLQVIWYILITVSKHAWILFHGQIIFYQLIERLFPNNYYWAKPTYCPDICSSKISKRTHVCSNDFISISNFRHDWTIYVLWFNVYRVDYGSVRHNIFIICVFCFLDRIRYLIISVINNILWMFSKWYIYDFKI